MGIFKLKSQLPQATQNEIDRVLAIASAQRTTVEANFLTSLTPYLYNEVILANASGQIAIAQGHSVPTGDSGFIKGARFHKVDETMCVTFQNVGTLTTSVWIALIEGAGAPVDYTDGDPVATGQDIAITGSRYVNLTTGDVYINTGDADEPVWEQLAFVA